jgi:hypothetical protein
LAEELWDSTTQEQVIQQRLFRICSFQAALVP